MNVLAKTGGRVRQQQMGGFGHKWSSDCQLWWTHGKPGDRLELQLPVKKTGKYKVTTNLTKAIDYAIIQFCLDGKNLGSPIDCWNDGVVATGPIDLGTRRPGGRQTQVHPRHYRRQPEGDARPHGGCGLRKTDAGRVTRWPAGWGPTFFPRKLNYRTQIIR